VKAGLVFNLPSKTMGRSAGDRSPHTLTYRPDIDGLRALAVLSVVVFHAFPHRMRGGFAGVDVFFVISGFLISGIIFENLRDGRFSFLDFYQRRARRILPALILLLCAVWMLGWFFLLPLEFKSLGEHFIAAAGFASNILLWTQSNYFDRAAITLPLLHLWSLGVEEQFYLLWPLACFLAWNRQRALLVIILAAGIGSFSFNILVAHAHPSAAFYLPVSRFWELMIGSGLAYRRYVGGWSKLPRWAPNVLSVGGTLAVVASFCLLRQDLAYPGWWGLYPTVGSAMLIAAGPTAVINRLILSNPVAVFIGLVSYPLYLWHWPLLSIARIVYGGDLSSWQTAGLCILAFGLACATYFAVERPLRFGALRAFPVATAAGLLGLLVMVGGFGYETKHAAGHLSRFADIQRITTYKFDYLVSYRVGTCHLNPWQSAEDFTADCYGAAGPHRLVLWGDSKAADLYPGLKDKITSQYSVEELTASGCPPLIRGYEPPADHPNCNAENKFILEHIKSEVPDIVILSMGSSLMPESTYPLLATTVSEVKKAGVPKVVVVGLSPVWHDTVPALVARFTLAERLHQIPARLPVPEDYLEQLQQGDRSLRA
jgi:peptidoglycan/LPS O-acetylase OafA/YrhL